MTFTSWSLFFSTFFTLNLIYKFHNFIELCHQIEKSSRYLELCDRGYLRVVHCDLVSISQTIFYQHRSKKIEHFTIRSNLNLLLKKGLAFWIICRKLWMVKLFKGVRWFDPEMFSTVASMLPTNWLPHQQCRWVLANQLLIVHPLLNFTEF